jgi:hypothetical protein
MLFELNKRTVRKNLLHGPQQPGPLGRHTALNPEVESSLMRMLLDAFHEEKAITQKEFLRIMREQHKPTLTKGWVHDFIGAHLDELRVCRSLPQENLRMAVPRAYLKEHIQLLKTHLTGKVAELVFNLNELGFADQEDRKAKKVTAPSGVAKEDMHHPVSRHYRHMRLLTCVSASGDALTPLVITASTFSDALSRRGLSQGDDAMIRHRSPAYITEELFYEYLSNVFLPYVLVVRDWPGFQNEMAVLLMESAVPHASDRVRRLLDENSILAISFPAHTTNLFQALDLVFFGVLKRLKASTIGEFDNDSVNAHITKLIREYEQTATSSTIRGSIRKAGLEHEITTRPFKLQVIEESLSANPGFQEIWMRDISIENLCWNSPFGC